MEKLKINNLSYKNRKIKKLLDEIINVIKENIKTPFKLYLFGSFATGKATYFSDIDIALETKEDLNLEKLRNLKDKLENIRTLRKIDLVYLNKASQNIKKIVLKEGILLYEFKG